MARNGLQPVQLDYVTDNAGLLGELGPHRVIRPLWLIIAGALICCITAGVMFNFHRQGQSLGQVRIADGPVGAAMILWGVWQLSRLNIDRDYNWMMRGILVVAILHTAKSIADCFPPPADPVIALLWVFVGMASLIAAICLALCMQWLSQEAGLRRSARNWLWTTIACGCFCIPAAILECVMLLQATSYAKTAQMGNSQPSEEWSWLWSWWWLVLLVPLVLGPPIGVVLSTWQMQREIERKLGRHV